MKSLEAAKNVCSFYASTKEYRKLCMRLEARIFGIEDAKNY